MERTIKGLIAVYVLFTSNLYANLPIYPAEIIARDLLIPGLGWAGHVGVTTAPYISQDAYQVYEALNERPVLQLNLINDFKQRSPYWGSRYGIADRGARAIQLLREASAQTCLGAEYTISSVSISAKGDTSSFPNCRTTQVGVFRCDTFLDYVYGVANYDITFQGRTTPALVFAQFPYGNGDGPKALTQMEVRSTTLVPERIAVITQEELQAMSTEEFMTILDIPAQLVSNKIITRLWELSLDPKMSNEKRLFLMDYIGVIANLEKISDFIEFYPKTQNLELKSMLLRNIQINYQKYLQDKRYSSKKEMVRNFYNGLLYKKLSIIDLERVIRGVIDLNSVDFIKLHFNLLDKLIAKLDLYTQIGIKTNLLFKAKELEKVIVPKIIELLNQQNNTQLDERFILFIIDSLSRDIDNLNTRSKKMIGLFLDSIKYKFNNDRTPLVENSPTMFGRGTWLEASALVNSTTLEEAGSYVANYLANLKTLDDKESFVIGLSNTLYMKKAFNTEPVLVDFKKQRTEIYNSSVGVTKE